MNTVEVTMSANYLVVESEIDGLKKAIQKKAQTLVEHACEQARATAQALYSAPNAGGATAAPKVQVVKANQYEAAVSAKGTSVCFLEFGAGAQAGQGGGYTSVAPVPTTPGSYSDLHARQYSQNGCWMWNGEKYTFIAPTRAMFEAMQTAIKTVENETKGGIEL